MRSVETVFARPLFGLRAHRVLWVLAAGLLAGRVAGCNPHTRRDSATLPVSVPTGYTAEPGDAPIDTEAAKLDRWWERLGDEALERLVAKTLAQNFDLHQAWARLTQVRALARQAGAGKMPQVSAEASTARTRAYGIGGDAQTQSQHRISVGASYEVDVWGRVDALGDAADLDVKASRLDVETIAMSLAAQVAETWYSLVEQCAQQRLLDAQIKTNQTLLDLVEARFAQGLASAVDVFQQRQNVIATQARVPLVETRVAVLGHQLSILAGQGPQQPTSEPGAALPTLPPLPALGVPTDLLARRPDIRSARLRAEAADHRIGAALADRFPTLRLNASTGFGATSFGDLLDRWLWSMTAGVVASLYDGGRRSAEVDRQRAVLEERLGALAGAILRAMTEVEDALVQERKQALYVEALASQIGVARQLLTETRLRYARGLSDFLPVLAAIQALQHNESALLTARRQLVSHRIQLYRALGGGWTADLKAPSEPLARKE